MNNRTLRRIVADATRCSADPTAEIERALADSRGPLVQAVDDDPGRVLVTFLCRSGVKRPVLNCPLVPGRDSRCGLEPLPGTSDFWFVEVDAPINASVTYHFELGAETVALDDESPLGHADQFATSSRNRYESSIADPHNPERCFPMSFLAGHGDNGGSSVPTQKWDSILNLPGADSYRWHDQPERRGRSHDHAVRSAAFGNTRHVTVWTPPQLAEQRGPLPAAILLDGEAVRRGLRAERVFDNLVGSGCVRPFIAVLVDNATISSRMSEYTCNPALGAFLADELLPELRPTYQLSRNPDDTLIGGLSLGGLAANWLAFSRPDVFGNVVSMSAALWWANTGAADQQAEWLTRQYRDASAKPVRFWIDVGSLETSPLPFAGNLSMLSASRRFRDVLELKGYEIAGYREQPGGHDYANWRRTLPLALQALWGD